VTAGLNVARGIIQPCASLFEGFVPIEVAMSNVGGSAVIRFDASDSVTLLVILRAAQGPGAKRAPAQG